MLKMPRKITKLGERPLVSSTGGAFMMVFCGSSCYFGPTSTRFLFDMFTNVDLASAISLDIAKQINDKMELVRKGLNP